MKAKNLLFCLLLVFVLNLIWEYSHYFLYNDLSGISPDLHLWIAAFTDMLILSMIFLIVSLKNKNINWMLRPKAPDYLIVIFLSLIAAFFIEFINLKLGRWAYTSAMPVIFGIGLSPLIQLAVTGIVSLVLMRIIFQ